APLGAAADSQCRLDSIAQSWAVLSGVADPARGRRAMAAVARELVRRPENLALLFAPPFDHPERDPGYVQAYLPGIRENGGQYTHAAAWSIFAFAALGNGDAASDLLHILNPVHRSATAADALHYGVEPYVLAGDVYSQAPTPGVVAGPGTPAPPVGSTAPASKPSSASASAPPACASTPAFRAPGPASPCATATAPPPTKFAWTIRAASAAASPASASTAIPSPSTSLSRSPTTVAPIRSSPSWVNQAFP